MRRLGEVTMATETGDQWRLTSPPYGPLTSPPRPLSVSCLMLGRGGTGGREERGMEERRERERERGREKGRGVREGGRERGGVDPNDF